MFKKLVMSIILSNFIFSSLYAFDLDKTIEKEALKKEVVNNQNIKDNDKNTSKINKNNNTKKITNIKKYLQEKQNEIIKAIHNSDKMKILQILNEVNNNITDKKLRMKFNSYIFWRYINYYSNGEELPAFSPSEMQDQINFLYKLVNFIDFTYDKDTWEVFLAFHAIANDLKILVQKYDTFKSLYYPLGVNDEYFYMKFFKLINSKFIKAGTQSSKFFERIFADFKKFVQNRNGNVNPDLMRFYLLDVDKLGLNYTQFFNKLAKNLISKNPFDSLAYYFVAKYYQKVKLYNDYEKYIVKALKYNVYNTKAWLNYINYLIDKKKYNLALKLVNYGLANNPDSYFQNKGLLYEGIIYYQTGLKKENIALLKKALAIFEQLNAEGYIQETKKYIKALGGMTND